MNEDPRDLFSRHGHLTGLTIDRYDAGELGPGLGARVQEHLEGCARCRAQLFEVQRHVVTLAPPVFARPSAGSVTVWGLAASGGLGLAAALVLSLMAAPWPGPQRVEPRPAGAAAPLASAYTTSALPESDVYEEMGVQLEVQGRWLEARPEGDGFLAIVVASGVDVYAMDTDGEGSDQVLEVLWGPTAVEPDAELRVRPSTGSHRVVALMCARPFEVEAGDPVVVGPDCRRDELEARFGLDYRDS